MITEGERKRRRIKRQGTEYRKVYCQKGVIEFMRQGLGNFQRGSPCNISLR